MLGNKTGVLIDEFDFTGAFFNAETDHSVAEKDSTVFGALATLAEPGLSSDKLMLRGYYSGYAAGAVFKELRTRLGAAGVGQPLAVLIDTDDANCIAECSADSWSKSLKLSLAAPELITFELNTADNGDMATGLRIASMTVTEPVAVTGVNFGSVGAAGGMAFLFVQSIVGTATNAVIKVESSVPGSYVEEASFTFSGVGGYVLPLSGAIGTTIRANVTNLGGATAIKFQAIVCVNGVTY